MNQLFPQSLSSNVSIKASESHPTECDSEVFKDILYFSYDWPLNASQLHVYFICTVKEIAISSTMNEKVAVLDV